MKRTPEEERIYQALSAIETPEASLEEGVRSLLERRERPAWWSCWAPQWEPPDSAKPGGISSPACRNMPSPR